MSDLISRQAVLEVQIKYAEHMGATKYWQMRDDIRALPSVTPQPEKRTEERTETHACDCISREAAYDEIIWNSDNGVIDAKVAIEALRKLPSVEPERPRGKWIYTENHCWICSECGKHPLKGTGFTPTLDGMRIQWKFCNRCGAKMEVHDEQV